MFMVKIRPHHLYNFVKALISEEYKERVYLRFDGSEICNGCCHGTNHAESNRQILESITDASLVEITLREDDLCKDCEAYDREQCSFPDSVWDAKELIGKTEQGQTYTVRKLKEAYFLHRRYKHHPESKRILKEQRGLLFAAK